MNRVVAIRNRASRILYEEDVQKGEFILLTNFGLSAVFPKRPEPNQFIPGCFLLDHNLNCYESMGGDEYIGAYRWQLVAE